MDCYKEILPFDRLQLPTILESFTILLCESKSLSTQDAPIHCLICRCDQESKTGQVNTGRTFDIEGEGFRYGCFLIWRFDYGDTLKKDAPFTQLDNNFCVPIVFSPFTQLDNNFCVQKGKGGSNLKSTFKVWVTSLILFSDSVATWGFSPHPL